MPQLDFFDTKYKREDDRIDAGFGICDNGTIAYTQVNSPHEWIAVVNNSKKKKVLFTPVDHNIIAKRGDGSEISQCDGMLTDNEGDILIFVELKTGRRSWITEAVEQLKSTISLFNKNHDCKLFKDRRAYAVNSRCPHFPSSHKEIMQQFRSQSKFRLLIQRNIDL